jgi:hypothetical protein
MTITDVLKVCYQRGVRLVIAEGQLHAQGKSGATNTALREGLAMHKAAPIEMLGVGVHPDPQLPDVVHYPVTLPNDDQSFRRHYETQRLKAA